MNPITFEIVVFFRYSFYTFLNKKYLYGIVVAQFYNSTILNS